MRGFLAAWAALFASGAAGCTTHHVTEVDLAADAARTISFFVVLDEANTITRTTTPLFVEADGTSRGTARSVTLDGDEAHVVLVRVPVEVLGPSFVGSRFDDVEVRVEAPPMERLRRFATGGGTVVDAAIPGDAELSRVDFEGATTAPISSDDALASRVRGAITLTTPVDPEFCRDTSIAPLAAFGAEAKLELPGEGGATTLRGLIAVEPDVVVVAAQGGLYVVRRGGRAQTPALVPGTPGPWLDLTALSPEVDNGFFAGLAVDPRDANGSSRRIVLAVTMEYALEQFRSAVYEVTYRDGTLGEVVTSTVFDHRARDVAFAADGTYAVIGDEGTFLEGRPDGTLRSLPIPAPVGPIDESRQVIATEDPEFPWVAATRGRLHRFVDERQAWSGKIIIQPSQESLHFAGLSAVREDGEIGIWALGSAGLLLKLEDGDWAEKPLVMPPSYGPCSPSGNVATPILAGSTEALGGGEGLLFPVKTGCTAVPVVRVSDTCTWMLPIEGRATRLGDDLIEVIDVFDGELFAAGKGAYLYSTRIAE
ncbi:MAG: hypothetical protein RMA76_28390 [Deltaproteobacteria bacterium]